MTFWQIFLVALLVCFSYDVAKWIWNRRLYCPVCGEHLKLEPYDQGSAEVCHNCHFHKNYKRYYLYPINPEF